MPGRARDVEWSQPAEADLDGIVGFIALERPQVARDVALRIMRLSKSLERAPLRGRVVPELKAIGLSAYRELLSPPWRMIYRIIGGKVTVLALLDGRRDLEETLLERLIHPS